MKRLLSAVLLLGCSTSSASPPQEVVQPDMGAYCPTNAPMSGVDVAVVPVPLALYDVAEPIELSALGVAGADEVEQHEIGRIAEIHSLAVGAEGDWTIAFHDLAEGAAWVDQCDLPRQRAVGAYFLQCDGESRTIDVIAPDLQGRFHALQTLQQLLNSQDGVTTLLPVTLYDAPAQEHRGVIEGFYGTPWPDDIRVDMMEALGDLKLNLFAYAPKEDASINVHWRQPLTSDDRRRIQTTLAAARAQRIELCWEVRPSLLPPVYSDPDEAAALCSKLEAVAAEGVPCLIVAFDDVMKVLDGADQERWSQYWMAQADFMGRVTERLRATLPGTRLLFVPHEYWTNHEDTLADLVPLTAHLDAAWDVGWTGPEIIAPTIRADDVDLITALLGRPPLLGDNYPVSDAAEFEGEIYLGPLTNREQAVAERVRMVVYNPMSLPYASLPALATAADWSWNPSAYEPEAARRRAASLYGGRDGAAALGALSDVLRSPLLETSVAPVLEAEIEAFWSARNTKGGASTAEVALRQRLTSFAAVTDGMPFVHAGMAAELDPWAAKLQAYGVVGLGALDMLADTDPPQPMVDALRQQVEALAAQSDVRPCGDIMDALLAGALDELAP